MMSGKKEVGDASVSVIAGCCVTLQHDGELFTPKTACFFVAYPLYEISAETSIKRAFYSATVEPLCVTLSNIEKHGFKFNSINTADSRRRTLKMLSLIHI